MEIMGGAFPLKQHEKSARGGCKDGSGLSHVTIIGETRVDLKKKKSLQFDLV